MTLMNSREFNQNVSGAKRAAAKEPVFITERGKLSHVLLSAEDYYALKGGQRSLVDMLAMPGAEDIEFDPPKIDAWGFKPADLD